LNAAGERWRWSVILGDLLFPSEHPEQGVHFYGTTTGLETERLLHVIPGHMFALFELCLALADDLFFFWCERTPSASTSFLGLMIT
jgi:hypothetical protein